jgi:hypothetical protein
MVTSSTSLVLVLLRDPADWTLRLVVEPFRGVCELGDSMAIVYAQN